MEKRAIKIVIVFLSMLLCGCSISVDHATLDFGSTETTKTFTLSIEGPLEWSISCNESWVTINSDNGVGGGTSSINVTVDRTGLSSGDYEATLNISTNIGLTSSDVIVKMSVLAAPPPPVPSEVTGYMYEKGTDDPLSGVSVSIGSKNDSSDSNGYYSISNVSKGSRTIEASKEGYEDYSSTIEVTDDFTEHDIYMTPETSDAPTVIISADPPIVEKGGNSKLYWVSTDATSASITPDIGEVPVTGSYEVKRIDSTLTYIITVDGPGGQVIKSTTVTVTDNGDDPPQPPPTPTLPYIVGAVSTGNTKVVASFSKKMNDNAVNPQNYSIVQENSDTDDSRLTITGAGFLDDSHFTVELTTLSQNEVRYLLTAVNMGDLSGNQISDPVTALFHGTPPAGDDFTDSDGDGLTDNEEQRGWRIIVVTAGGQEIERYMTSDPYNADTEGDGIPDGDEKAFGTDPRSRDTDADQLTDYQELIYIYSDPLHQDTDGDSLMDGIEFNFFKTSPLFADTDGDQIDDDLEIVLSNRNPRIADLPWPRIKIGNFNLALDVRFSYTDTEGMSQQTTESVESTLSQSESQTYSTSDEESLKASLELSTEVSANLGFDKDGPSGGVSAKVGTKSGLEMGNTSSFSKESTEASEEAYHESLTTSATVDLTHTVTREVVDANVLADVTVENIGDIAFKIGNLELTALQQDQRDKNQFIPVASLIPENPDLGELTLGVEGHVSQKGPIVFHAASVFPNQVEDLLKNPRGLIIKLSNFDITDEFDRNFAFASQSVFERTAAITIDFGDGRVESYRVATHSTFDESGNDRGITMEYALNDILGLSNTPAIRDGGNGICETAASGDDVQVNPQGEAVEPGSVLITAGDNGTLETLQTEGDDLVVEPDYEITEVEREVNDENRLVRILTGFKGIQTGVEDDNSTMTIDESRRFWVVFSSTGLNPAVDFEKNVLRAGEQFTFMFVQDKDSDGVYAREEYLYGSSDLNPNTDGCPDDDAGTPEYDGTCTEGRFDTLSDFEEIKEGWAVQVERQLARMVYPDPVQPDSDGDILLDNEERDCGLDPRQRDTDLDGISDYDEIMGYKINEANGMTKLKIPAYAGQVIIDGGDGICNSVALEDDIQVIPQGGVVEPGGILITAGDNGTLETSDVGGDSSDDFIAVKHLVVAGCMPEGTTAEGFATDPLNADTDSDGIIDGYEVELGINPNNRLDGGRYRDADRDGVPDAYEEDGFLTIINGSQVTVFSDPYDSDSDDDRLPDLLEHMLKSNPEAADTDGDGISDFDEFNGSDTCIPDIQQACKLFAGRFQEFLDLCYEADACLFIESDLDDYNSLRTGTNLNEADTDADSLTDPFELFEGWDVSVDGGQPYHVLSSARERDADNDDLDDNEEEGRKTDPNNYDTDGDGDSDGYEISICVPGKCRNPLWKDQKITLRYISMSIAGQDCDYDFFGDENWGEWYFKLKFRLPGDTMNTMVSASEGISLSTGTAELCQVTLSDGRVRDAQCVNEYATFNISASTERSFIANFGEKFDFAGFIQELDDGADYSFRYGPEGCLVDCGFSQPPDVTQNTAFEVSSGLTDTTVSYSLQQKCGPGPAFGADAHTVTVSVNGKITVE
jgi:hypothetical protein